MTCPKSLWLRQSWHGQLNERGRIVGCPTEQNSDFGVVLRVDFLPRCFSVKEDDGAIRGALIKDLTKFEHIMDGWGLGTFAWSSSGTVESDPQNFRQRHEQVRRIR